MTRQFDSLLLGSIEIFCLSAEQGSFSRAANMAGITPAAVSRSISRLEQRLGVRLFERSTRKMHLTDAGQRYFAQCKQAITNISDAEKEISGNQLQPSGPIRITAPTSIGHSLILPILATFQTQHPEVSLDIELTNRNIDLIKDGFDLAIRARTPPDSRLIARKLIDAKLVVVATPEYLAKAGEPTELNDLDHHECIQFMLPSSGQYIPWLFRKQNTDIEITTHGKLRCSEDYLAAVTLAKHHSGLLQTYRVIVDEDIKNGNFIEVLTQYSGSSRVFSLLYPSKQYLPTRVRLLIDFLLDAVQPLHPD